VRAEIHISGGTPVPRVPARRPGRLAAARAALRVDGFELGVLALFGALSVWVLALDLYQVIAHGLVWTGTDGFYPVDQMQYLAWIRDASHHVLVANLFVLRPTPADYFQPAVALSGGLTALGVAPWLSLLLWKPVAVITMFYAVRAFMRRSLNGVWARRAGLVLGLFFGSFTVIYGNVGVIGDLFPAFLSWGYTFGLLALATMILALVAYERARRGASGKWRALAWTPALLGAFASSLHPWQGELLIVIIIATEAMLWLDERALRERFALPAMTVAVTAIPLLYYEILGRADESWNLARDASKHSFSFATVMLAVAPLAVFALLAWRPERRSFIAIAIRAWVLAAILIYLISASGLSATPLHAFEGITVPLAVLAIEGWRRLGLARISRRLALATGAVAVAAATIPATVNLFLTAKSEVAPAAAGTNFGNANFITRGESDALSYLARDPQSGGVLTRYYLGALVPGETGRRTFVGDCLWSEPNCVPRALLAEDLFDGAITPARARELVTNSGARFVLADCQTTANVQSILAPMLQSVHRFGCATVYELDSPSPPRGPLAELPPDAALRASGRQQRRVQSS
jgi:hypothetical protein